MIATRALKAAVTMVAKYAEGTSNPITACVLIEAGAHGLRLTTTNIESTAILTIPDVAAGNFRTAVDAAKFREVVASASCDELSIEFVEPKLIITGAGIRAKLLTVPADDFPLLPPRDPSVSIVGTKEIGRAAKSTLFALPKKDHRRVLLGVLTEIEGDNIRFTGTDGKKLCRHKVDCSANGSVDLTIPRDFAAALGDLADGATIEVCTADVVSAEKIDGKVTTTKRTDAKRVSIIRENFQLHAQPIDGKYPDCDQVIPKDFATQFPINPGVLAEILGPAATMVDEKTQSAVFTFADNKVTVEAVAFDSGAIHAEAAIEYEGAPVELAFNVNFLRETISHLGPKSTLHFKNGKAPVIFSDEDQAGQTLLLMPIKLSDARPQFYGKDEEADDCES